MSGPALLAVEQGCQSVKLGKLFLEWVTVLHREGHILPRGLAMSRAVSPGRLGAGGTGLWLGLLCGCSFWNGFESPLYPCTLLWDTSCLPVKPIPISIDAKELQS